MARKLPKIISQEEFEKLFAATRVLRDKSTKVKKKRINGYMLAMLLGMEAGMRISEIVGLRILNSKCCKQSIDEIKQKNKSTIYKCSQCNKDLGVKDKIRSLTTWAIKPLTRDKIEVSSIFISEGKGKKDRVVPRPKRFNSRAINALPIITSRRPLQRFITTLGDKVLNKHITFHTLRHGFGTHLANSMPLHQVQMLMGHSRLDTTGMYLHANPKQAIDSALEAF